MSTPNLPRQFTSYDLACANGGDTNTASFVTIDANSLSIMIFSTQAVTASLVFTDSKDARLSVIALGAVAANTVTNFAKSVGSNDYIGSFAQIRITNASGSASVVDVFVLVR